MFLYCCLWRERVPRDIPTPLRYRDQNKHWNTIESFTFWLMMGTGLILAIGGVITWFSLTFHWAFPCLQNSCGIIVAKVSFLAWATKSVEISQSITTFMVPARKEILATIIPHEFWRHGNAQWNVRLNHDITQPIAKVNLQPAIHQNAISFIVRH